MRVSIHAPTWGATKIVALSDKYVKFQSTRPRGARRRAAHAGLCRQVSIHAPTWGATIARPSTYRSLPVSIHAPTWGATSITLYFSILELFQSTRPRGARQRGARHLRGMVSFQSTRPRGARLDDVVMAFEKLLFQSTRPRGARPGKHSCPSRRGCFNPRAHVGRDIMTSTAHWRWCSFNPRAHVGRDGAERVYQLRPYVSIHAPTWGATLYASQVLRYGAVSIHAPTWGATRQLHQGGDRPRVSIHAPTWGATASEWEKLYREQFQSTRPRGARQKVFSL